MLANDLNRRLMAIRRNYYHKLMSNDWAKESGRRVIEDEFKVLLRVSRDRIRYSLGRVSELPPEELERLVRWKNEYILDWGRIIDGIKRVGD